jgi:diguanylate cyclase (GGDEF)-like protein
MADIDHFKSINDQFGHDAGDKVLKAVANCFNEYLGKNDVACRWGGEEFLIYLPEENLKLAKRIIQAIGSVLKDTDIDGHFVTMSFGLVESDGSDTIDSLLHKADTLLYQAKAQGRDNVQTRQKST